MGGGEGHHDSCARLTLCRHCEPEAKQSRGARRRRRPRPWIAASLTLLAKTGRERRELFARPPPPQGEGKGVISLRPFRGRQGQVDGGEPFGGRQLAGVVQVLLEA